MGKARSFSTESEEANYQKQSEDETYVSTQQNSYNLGSITFSDQSGIANIQQGGTDQRKADLTGALFRGNIGFLLQSAVLDETSETINLLEDQSGNAVTDVSTDRIVIISGVANTSNLTKILGAQRPGQRFTLYNTNGNAITVKDATTTASSTDPNLIRTPGGVDFEISGFDTATFTFDLIEEQWRVVGSGGAGSPITPTFISADLSADQTTNLAVNDHVEFDRNTPPTGADGGIVLQTGAGQLDGIFELKADKTYFLTAAINPDFSAANSVEFVWYDITNTTEIGRRTVITDTSLTMNQPKNEIIFTPSTDVTVEVRIVAVTTPANFAGILSDYTFASIFELLGSGGGSGYVQIQDEGIDLTKRTTMNFIGSGVTAVDNPGTMVTDITINAPSGTIPDGTNENDHLEWDETGMTWEAVGSLTMGSTGPFATSGLINYANNNTLLAARNDADDGDLKLIVDDSDRFVFQFPGPQEPLLISEDEIDVNTVDIIQIDRAKFIQNSGSMVSATDKGILVNSSGDLQLNVDDSSKIVFDFENNQIASVELETTGGNNGLLTVQSEDNTGGAFTDLFRNDTSGNVLAKTVIGSYHFSTGTTAASTKAEYASIVAIVEDPTSGAFESSLDLNVADGSGAQATFISLNDDADGIITAFKDVTIINDSLNPVLTFFRDEPGVTDNQIGTIIFKGQTSSGGDFVYSSITSDISDDTLGQEDSIIKLSTTNDGIFADVQLTVNADSSQILRFASSSIGPSFKSPILEFYTTDTFTPPPTGAVQRIGEINFEATTNDAGGIGAVETFAQIIVDQEDSDIDNEAAGMRFRLRDQTATTGALKTYLSFNQGNNDLIQASKTLDMEGNQIHNVQSIFTNDDTGNNVLGALDTDIDNPGGWELFIHRRITSDEDASMYIEFDTGGLEVVSDAQLNLIANNTMILAADDANWILGTITGMTWFVDGSSRMRIQDTALTLFDDVDFNMEGEGNINLNEGYIEFDSVSGPDTPGGDRGRMYAAIDPETFAVTPYWIDSVGTITSMILSGGGGTGTGGAGTNIVKSEDTTRSLSPVLDADPELVFQPKRNTLYFIEINLRYLSSGTGLKCAIQGGDDMTYRIVQENTLSTPNDWSPEGGSNDEFVVFPSTAGNDADTDSHSVVLYAIVQVNTEDDDIAFSWAQNTNNFQDTTIFAGSIMRVFGEGISGGSNGQVSQISIGTSGQGPSNEKVDTQFQFFGCNNGFDNIDQTLPTSDSGENYTYELTSADFPSGIPGMDMDNFGVYITGVVHTNGDTGSLSVQGFLNNTPYGSVDTSVTSSSGFRIFYSYNVETAVSPGDTIGVSLYTQAGSPDMTLEDVTVYVIPKNMTITSKHMSIYTVGISGDNHDLLASQGPDGSAAITQGENFQWNWNGETIRYSVGNQADQVNQALFGDGLFNAGDVRNLTTPSTSGDMRVPGVSLWTTYTNVE